MIWLSSRILYYGLAWIISHIHQIPFAKSIFAHWDAGWYMTIIEHGYMRHAVESGWQKGQANWAFFPVMPLLTRGITVITNMNPIVVGYLVSNLAFLVALVYLYKYLSLDFSSHVVRFTTLFMALSPVNVYLTSIYTESVFLALLIVMIYYVRQHNWLAAGISGALLTGTRNTGIFMILIYVFEFIRARQFRKPFSESKFFYVGLLFFPTGLLLFMLHLRNLAGDPLAFYHIQSSWSQIGVTARTFFGSIFTQPSKTVFLNFSSLFVAVLTLVYLFAKKRWMDFYVLIPVVLISIFAYRIQYRFYFALYPIYLVVANVLQERKWLIRCCIFIEVIVLAIAINYWITGVGPT